MTEGKLEVKQNGEYNNIYPKGYPKIGAKGLEPGQFVLLKKAGDYAEGYKREAQGKFGPYNTYDCRVEYDGVECGMRLFRDDEHESFKLAGGIGDTIKCELNLVQDAKGAYRPRLTFSKVEA